MNLNKVIIAGNLTRSPELRHTTNGTPVATFGMATNRAWTDERGDRQDEVEFHNITVFGKQAETAAEYLRKGQLALIEGRLRTSSWETEGVKRSRTSIVAERIQFGPKRQEEVDDTDDGSLSADRSDQGIAVSAGPNTDSPIAEQHMDDDVPF